MTDKRLKELLEAEMIVFVKWKVSGHWYLTVKRLKQEMSIILDHAIVEGEWKEYVRECEKRGFSYPLASEDIIRIKNNQISKPLLTERIKL